MKNCQTISFSDFLAHMDEVPSNEGNDFTHLRAKHKAWGSLENRTFKNKFFGIHQIQADFNDMFRISFDEQQMLNNMNICLTMNGKIGLDLKESDFNTSLSSRKHHCIYSPETRYDLIIDKSVHVVHITVDREYYAGLLQENERTEAIMKKKLLSKDLVWNGTGNINLALNRAVHDILFNPLEGNLKSLFIEGKILEVVALQLNEFKPVEKPKTCFRDEEIFFEIRKYLDDHFKEEMSLRSLSRMFGVNEFKLKKGFKTLFQSTVFDYIHELKMMHARTLLLDEKMLVNEVAGTIGYKNANHFSTAFKRKFGISPTSLK
jgi:AraC family transcriptional regulator, transcriptional activator of the genes for pyochelin and ferripyochelin receptors